MVGMLSLVPEGSRVLVEVYQLALGSITIMCTCAYVCVLSFADINDVW